MKRAFLNMQSQNKFSLLRKFLTALGLSTDAVDDIVERIEDFLSVRDEKPASKPEYPYFARDHFLSPAEHSFFMVLKSVVSDSALISIKVGLGDLFCAKSSDSSKYRIYTNKIDRKHVDFLLCDPKTVQPIVGIELDDKSHQRSDRQARDEFVENVFQAARLPLVRIPVKHAYSTGELQALIKPYLSTGSQAVPSIQVTAVEPGPICPKCGSEMILRTAKSGANQGENFWGCSKFPQCRGMLKYSVPSN
jgi:predicted RNA-binding Zn-ribbon protein involved in translation (DUF1610 family)